MALGQFSRGNSQFFSPEDGQLDADTLPESRLLLLPLFGRTTTSIRKNMPSFAAACESDDSCYRTCPKEFRGFSAVPTERLLTAKSKVLLPARGSISQMLFRNTLAAIRSLRRLRAGIRHSRAGGNDGDNLGASLAVYCSRNAVPTVVVMKSAPSAAINP